MKKIVQKKRALCVASMASNLDNFNRNNVKILRNLGYDVTLASNFHTSEDTNSQEKIDSFIAEMERDGVHIVQIDFSRRIRNIRNQLKSYRQMKRLIAQGYDLIHCHAPICAAITRMCAKKYQKQGKSKVLYTAHGFHFYDGAPLKNWLIFYPVEKHYSRYTDILITINKEDYKRANEKFHAKKTVYVPGIGVDTEKFAPRQSGREKIRAELGLREGQIMLLSVGELNENKNHESVVRAIQGMEIIYVIVGKGELKDKLGSVAKECSVCLRLMGFRNDVADFYDAADIYVLPSIREGLNVSLMEAMASGLACVCGRIRGNIDLIEDERCLFNPVNQNEIRVTINTAIANREDLGRNNLEKIKNFDISTVNDTASEIYRGMSVSDN